MDVLFPNSQEVIRVFDNYRDARSLVRDLEHWGGVMVYFWRL